MAEADLELAAPPAGVDPKTSRRGFLAGAAGLTGVALGVGSWEPVFAAGPASAAPVAAITADKRGTMVSHVEIELDQKVAGFLQSAEGGNATSDVVNEKVGADGFTRKHLAGVKYEDITVNAGTGMNKAFYDWVKSSFSPTAPQRKSGAIVAADFNFKELQRMTFANALITEVGMPALDAASKDAAKMTIKLSPEFTRMVTKPGASLGTSNQKVLKWSSSNYQLLIDGLDTSRVSKIEALVIKQKVTENPTGDNRDFGGGVTTVEFPNVKLTLAESSATTWFKWHEDFVINGNNGQAQEKKGSLSFLTPDLKTELFKLNFTGLGIFKLDPDPWSNTTASIRRVSAELYVEEMTFTYLGAGVT
jgi:phage tail-like protein